MCEEQRTVITVIDGQWSRLQMLMPKQYQNKSLAGSFGFDCQGLGKCMKCKEIYDSSKAY